jgi:cytochrome c-type biogenesis protein CcmH/NrfG
VPELESAVRLDAANPASHFHLAVAYAQAGRYGDARAQAMETLRLDPNDAAARALLAQLGAGR